MSDGRTVGSRPRFNRLGGKRSMVDDALGVTRDRAKAARSLAIWPSRLRHGGLVKEAAARKSHSRMKSKNRGRDLAPMRYVPDRRGARGRAARSARFADGAQSGQACEFRRQQ